MEPGQHDRTPAEIAAFVEELRRIAADPAEPESRRALARAGIDFATDVVAAYERGDHQRVAELVLGTPPVSRLGRPDGMNQILPLWARGREELAELFDHLEYDPTASPPTVTVHWERIPTQRRRAVASLASQLVDERRERPKGGRPRKITESGEQETG